MAAQAWLNEMDDGYEMDEGLTWPATAPGPASRSGHVPNPILARTIVPDSTGWSDGFHLLATQMQEEDRKELAPTGSDPSKAGNGPMQSGWQRP